MFFFFFKQKTAYEMRISDWSSDVCSSDLATAAAWTASERASSSRPWAIAACASSSARRAWETSSAAYWSASAFPARATACRAAASRSEERRVVEECVSTCRTRRSPDNLKNKHKHHDSGQHTDATKISA